MTGTIQTNDQSTIQCTAEQTRKLQSACSELPSHGCSLQLPGSLQRHPGEQGGPFNTLYR